jgi:hypothetical protein
MFYFVGGYPRQGGAIFNAISGSGLDANQHRVHQYPNADTPAVVTGDPDHLCARIVSYSWRSDCNDLFQIPIAE